MNNKIYNILLLSALCFYNAHGKSDPGKMIALLKIDNNVVTEQRPMLANTKIYVKIECSSSKGEQNLFIFWRLTERRCWWYSDVNAIEFNAAEVDVLEQSKNTSLLITSPEISASCPNHLIVLPEFKIQPDIQIQTHADIDTSTATNDETHETEKESPLTSKSVHPLSPTSKPIVTIPKDGIYDWELIIKTKKDFTATVHYEIIGPHGYISATDWPLLPFYGIMCIVYVIFGINWLIVSFMQWRDLLRIQFWIGGVIFLGMLEKAFFYAQYHSLNITGLQVQGAELTAEFVSCAKRTLARMLVIIMSLGFGIVKPRLGPMLHRVVGVGALYFILACVESYLRVMRSKANDHNELLVASIPLAVLDTGICWWIFTSLVQTTRTLRLRRNMVKLTLYKHFTNTLIFSVIASVIFMICVLRLRKTENCTPGWHEIWIDTAFWHVLFSVLLLVIMTLWRPTNNNQRYAFTPLLDNPEDDDDDEEDQFVADAYGVKMRGTHVSNGTKTPPNSQRATTMTEEDDLRWVEENIPSSMVDPALPILDSDEEIINTKFEVSKMQ